MPEIILLDTHAWLWYVNGNTDQYPQNWNHRISTADLTPAHRDPFDRIIIATALEHNAILATVDGLFTHYPELNGRILT